MPRQGPRDVALLAESRGAVETPLGQLAQVLKLVARSEPSELSKLTEEVLLERRRLEDELQRRRSLEEQLREARGRLDEAAQQRRKSQVEAQAAQRRIAQMQDELVFVTREVSNAEEERLSDKALKALTELLKGSERALKGPAAAATSLWPREGAEDTCTLHGP